ncbi:hypothetical protein B0A48_03968 [Cryoendolithus antarcticus]|uniref:Uncharacterized protein n=1 Tax=Cryoendolithus antarcticus TaxID=1507870 RepID=A0A1V8TH37_9PEZI|nr:hypothetical protein B0A48_03968 [Cryoendolithus antarcticus]
MAFPPYFGPWGAPIAENTQQASFNWNRGYDPFVGAGLRRSAPAENGYTEYNPILRQWEQNGIKMPRHWRPKHYFTRPSDGKRPGFLGRLKDVAQGEGADVFITTSGDKRTLMRDRPQRYDWAGWGLNPWELWERQTLDPDWRLQDQMLISEAPWSVGVAPRGGNRYNFRSRLFEDDGKLARQPRSRVWMDARWAPGVGRRSQFPECVKDMAGDWYTNFAKVSPFAGYWPGGRPYS